jgi:hypothetical protein
MDDPNNLEKGTHRSFTIEFNNNLVSKYFTQEKIENAFSQMSLNLTVDEKTFKKFKINARNELKEIE